MVDSSMLAAVSVVIAEGKRPVSFRTRKLSPPAPMVLHSGGCGRVGRRRTQREGNAHPGQRGGRFLYFRTMKKGPAPQRGRPFVYPALGTGRGRSSTLTVRA